MTLLATQVAFILLVVLIFAPTDGNPLPTSDHEKPNHGILQIDWLRSKGGYVNSKLEVRRVDREDPSSRFGMFTKENMNEDEILLTIPRDCLITDEGAEYGDIDLGKMSPTMDCRTVANLIKEMRLGNDSFYSAYVNYLVDEPWGSIPSSWSEAGQKLITRMLLRRTRYPIPPEGVAEWIRFEWRELCNGSTDPFEENAALMVVQRSWDNLLIPVYDMMSHRNGHWLNTKCNEVHGEDSIVVRAKRDIQAGEEMYVSYNMCEDCGGRAETYGTFEILRDYGFVEQYPQRWIFPESVGFEVDEVSDGSGKLSLEWIGEEPDETDIDFLEEVLFEMEDFGRTSLQEAEGKVDSKELATVRDFHRSLSIALSLAIDYATGDVNDCSAGEENCVITLDRYDDLNVDSEEDEFYTRLCENEHVMLFDKYNIVEEIKTPYQHISVMHDPSNNDMCFDLENIVQIATSYRPHYHEVMVHYAARFLKDVQRVLFVGGGDSMLLHEVVKYQNLELVVGLELDQQVTRMSFKHFGVQPLWDNKHVQWWFGDATKSLLMLPKEYFGSFDMVLVDLSETVMSFKVTDEMDVMEALSLLLKPDGIMVKNEVYFEDMSEIFEHTLMVHYNDVPVICSQAMVLGSKNINFLKDNITNHGIDSQNLYILPDIEQYDIIHDYAWNSTNRQKHCKREDDEVHKEASEQIKSPGIIMCLEAENASLLVPGSLGKIVKVVGKSLEDEGLTLISSFVPKTTDEVFVIVMKEGYITTRLWSKEKYCAFDIHLWSSFEKHEQVKNALLSSIGSSTTSASSFRVVAGGMFGVNTWRDDENKRGPLRTDACERTSKRQSTKAVDQDAIDIILKESMHLAKGKGDSIVVVCGKKNSGPCVSDEGLNKVQSVTHLHTLWSCIEDAEDTKNYPWLMYSCEQKILQLLEAESENMKVRAIIFDQTMGYRMGQVMFKILRKISNRRKFFETDFSAIAMSTTTNDKNDSTDDSWQRILINRIRKDIHYYDPVYLGQIFYYGSDSNIEVNIVAKDGLFMQRLREVTSNIEKQTGLVSDIRSINGGIGRFNHDYTPKQFYKPSDYDQSSPMKQWSSQRPLEDQTIFQLEGEDITISTAIIKDGLEKSLKLVNSANCPSATAEVEIFSDVGDGCVLVAIWSTGRVVVVWDGRKHIDINLSNVAQMDEVLAKFDEHFIKQLPFKMKTVLRDVQSRGYGRTVSFLKDTKSGFRPHWIE